MAYNCLIRIDQACHLLKSNNKNNKNNMKIK